MRGVQGHVLQGQGHQDVRGVRRLGGPPGRHLHLRAVPRVVRPPLPLDPRQGTC